MKLHRIRVTNLNSLYGEQLLDLDADLHGASLFLIQGPTGSGKSTLMDAVSLALFGTTPRLDMRAGRDVAEQVMSRGTGVSLAELEFSKWSSSGEGRVRYRATWKARRARKHASGKMQDIERSVERLQPDGTWLPLVSSSKIKVYAKVFDEVLEGFELLRELVLDCRVIVLDRRLQIDVVVLDDLFEVGIVGADLCSQLSDLGPHLGDLVVEAFDVAPDEVQLLCMAIDLLVGAIEERCIQARLRMELVYLVHQLEMRHIWRRSRIHCNLAPL